MKKFSGVLLASDFDATLTDSNGQIPENNIDAIKYFISEGGLFTVSTGRTREGFHKYDSSIINAPVMVSNGAMAYDYSTGKVVYSSAVEIKDMPLFSRIAEKYPGMCIEFFTVDKGAYVLNPDEITFGHFIGLQYNYTEITEITENLFPLTKVMLGVRKRTFEVQDYLKNTDMGDCTYIPCTGTYVEVMNKKAGKGAGLIRLADILGIKHRNVYAAGDGANDTDMLEAASLGFAPSSGDPMALKKADKIVCGKDEGAIAGAIAELDKIY